MLLRTVFLSLLIISSSIAMAEVPEIMRIDFTRSEYPALSELGIIGPGAAKAPIVNLVPIDNILTDKPLMKASAPRQIIILDGETTASASAKEILFPGGHIAFWVDTDGPDVEAPAPDNELNPRCYEAMEKAPKWMEDYLNIKFRILKKYSKDGAFAQLILDAEDRLTDETAFVIAHLSKQALLNARFNKDAGMIIKNAEFIYNAADSLKYVELVERGDYNSGDYYTTARYKIKDGPSGAVKWVEIPRDIYYWYVVHPKIRQEGLYAADDILNNQQRTYGHSWRDYIWNNPNPDYDYTNVNKTTSKGTIENIERFAERIKKADILWDRQKTYYNFNRNYANGGQALDIIGNWCSRAIPVDAELPRAIQPNQALYEHNGNCGEDAYLVSAACRTALIPVIHRNTSCEDHAFGAIWDEGWNHYEFFRGGLSGGANPAYGITNLMAGGGYGWTTSIVEGYRPDGFCENHTEEYSGLCTIDMTVRDVDGFPVDGCQAIFFADPGAYRTGYHKSGQAWTDANGKIIMKVGGKSDNTGKKYGFQLYHPKFGLFPSKEQIYTFIRSPAIAGREYKADVKLPEGSMPAESVNSQDVPPEGDIGIKIKIDVRDIISGAKYDESFPWDEFHYWKDARTGLVSFFLCTEDNYQKFLSGEPFDAYQYRKNMGSVEITTPLPKRGIWRVVLSNRRAAANLQCVEAECELIEGAVTGLGRPFPDAAAGVSARPNPFNAITEIDFNLARAGWVGLKVYDMLGVEVSSLVDREMAAGAHTVVFDGGGLNPGAYYYVLKTGRTALKGKLLLIK